MLPDGCAAAFRVASTTLDASAFVHGEAAVKPISSVALEGHTPAETEVTTIIVQSVELLHCSAKWSAHSPRIGRGSWGDDRRGVHPLDHRWLNATHIGGSHVESNYARHLSVARRRYEETGRPRGDSATGYHAKTPRLIEV
jgi:hypothetical protein